MVIHRLSHTKAGDSVRNFSQQIGKWLPRHPPTEHLLIRPGIALPLLAFLNLDSIFNSPLLKNKEDGAMDLMMQAFQASPPSEKAIPLAFIDIDEATYQAWGEAPYSPSGSTFKTAPFFRIRPLAPYFP